MSTEPAPTIWIVLGTVLALVVWFVVLFSAIMLVCRYLTRWPMLVARYPFQPPQEGFRTHYQTVMIGVVRFKRVVSLYLSPDGLGLRIPLPFFAPITIPWVEITAATPARMYWAKAVRLSIGNPPVTTVTLPWQLYQETLAHLGPDALSPLPEMR